MKALVSSCNCGNMVIKGQLTSLSSSNDIVTKTIKTLFEIDFQSLEIQNIQRAAKHLCNKSYIRVKCLLCQTVFKMFSISSQLYFEKVQPINHSSKQFQSYLNNNQKQKINNSTIIHFSDLFRPFVFSNKRESKEPAQNESQNQLESNKFNDEDTDFDIMFSNQYDPFVGSYKQQNISIPFDEC